MEYQKISGWQKRPELSKLNDLTTKPKEIFYCGRWNPKIFKNCTAVVGSRRMTEYGRRVLEKIIPQLVFQGKTIVSGFMYGVDQYSHDLCCQQGGKTIAVLGWGINLHLEDYDRKLAQKIINNGGLLISEWMEQKPTLWTFPARNRIVAALSEEIIVIEAAEKSGSLITARIAERLKRKIWAIPGPITSRMSAGTNNLIASGKAKIWIGDSPLPDQTKKSSSDPLLKLLENEALSTNEISRKMGKPVAEIGAQLSLLSLSGQLIEKEGKYFLSDAS